MLEFFTSFDSGSGALWILLLGLALKLMGFAVRDELMLRLLVGSGLLADAIYYGFRPEPIVPSILSNVALLSINLVLVVAILFERTTWRMTPDDRAVFAHFPTLTPGQFRRLRRLMTTEDCAPGTVLTREGAPVTTLMLTFADKIDISKSGLRFPISGPVFVGEVAFLTGAPSSADVTLPDGGRVLRFDAAALRARMARAPALNNAMVALFGRELARKVAYSVPMDRAAPTAPPANALLPEA
ncbi:hypothetical protein V8J82_00890 [Gymnodinialimonas sp. 2305UL16-5]|uniref:hypothetical protein n=1 Tax=Gymnodinialimonas mytili TaxID=3126503 RepID=UPI0030A6096E